MALATRGGGSGMGCEGKGHRWRRGGVGCKAKSAEKAMQNVGGE